jgi:hypothetical protein
LAVQVRIGFGHPRNGAGESSRNDAIKSREGVVEDTIMSVISIADVTKPCSRRIVTLTVAAYAVILVAGVTAVAAGVANLLAGSRAVDPAADVEERIASGGAATVR